MSLTNPAEDHALLRLCGLQRHVRLEARIDTQVMRAPDLRRIDLRTKRMLRHEVTWWNPRLRLFREAEPWRHDADDRERLTVQADRGAKRTRVGAISTLPVGIGHDHDACPAGVVCCCQRPAERRAHLHDIEESGRDDGAGDAFWPVEAGHIERGVPQRAHRRKALGLPLPVEKETGRLIAGRHDPIGVRIRQRAHQRGVDDREDRGIGADAQRNRQQDHHRESRRLRQEPHGIAKILDQHVPTPFAPARQG